MIAVASFIFLVLSPIFALCQNGPIANTPLGPVLGLTLTSRRGIDFYAFRGIRFAEQPEIFQVSKLFLSRFNHYSLIIPRFNFSNSLFGFSLQYQSSLGLMSTTQLKMVLSACNLIETHGLKTASG